MQSAMPEVETGEEQRGESRDEEHPTMSASLHTQPPDLQPFARRTYAVPRQGWKQAWQEYVIALGARRPAIPAPREALAIGTRR